MKFGLEENIIDKITRILEDQPKVDKAYIFGSRAKGNFRPDSDIDIAVNGYDFTVEDILKMNTAIDKSGIGYDIDLVDYGSIKEEALRDHIDRIGIQIYSQWNEYTLGQLGKVVTGKTPSSKFPEEFGDNIPFVTPSDYKYYNKWISLAGRNLSSKGVQKLKGKILPPNSLLVTCIGSDMGKVAINRIPVVSNQQINAIIPNQRVNPDFLYYILLDTYDELRKYGQAGSAIPILNKGDFETIRVELPSLMHQSNIAKTLSSLDNKIDLLQVQNKTLESITEVLFREGFTENEKSELEEKKLEELIWFDPREKIDRNVPSQFFEMKCLSNTDMSISFSELRTVKSGSIFRNGDTLLAKITPCLENGKTGFVMQLSDNEVAMGSTEFIVMRSKGLVSPYWIYCLARSEEFRDNAILSMTGTSGRQRVQLDLLKNIKVKIEDNIMKEFHQMVSPLFKKIKSNQNQIHSLTALRNTLLPKLLSGEARVKIP